MKRKLIVFGTLLVSIVFIAILDTCFPDKLIAWLFSVPIASCFFGLFNKNQSPTYIYKEVTKITGSYNNLPNLLKSVEYGCTFNKTDIDFHRHSFNLRGNFHS